MQCYPRDNQTLQPSEDKTLWHRPKWWYGVWGGKGDCDLAKTTLRDWAKTTLRDWGGRQRGSGVERVGLKMPVPGSTVTSLNRGKACPSPSFDARNLKNGELSVCYLWVICLHSLTVVFLPLAAACSLISHRSNTSTKTLWKHLNLILI